MVDFEVGDPVWAKMKGFPPWPAKILCPPPDSKAQKNKHFVYFFGSNNHAWIADENISHHNEQHFLNSISKKKTPILQNAIDALLSYSKYYKQKKHDPKVKKKENKHKKSQKKIVKVIDSVSKKRQRSVLANKSLIKSKKSLKNHNESATYPSSELEDNMSVISEVPHPVSLYSSFFRNDLVTVPNDPESAQHMNLHYGFIGLGQMGKNIVKTLIQSGHDMTVWNRTLRQCDMFLIMGAKRARSPADLILNCDITFCCVSDPQATKAIIFDEQGVLKGLSEAAKLNKGRRGFVNMTTIDPETSVGISEAIKSNCGLYLEASLYGTSLDAANGKLLILASGNRGLFSECKTCFYALAQSACYLSSYAGEANKMNLILSTLSGTMYAALAEAMVVIEKLKIPKENFLDCLEHMHCPPIYEKAKMMANLSFGKVTALTHVQKDIQLALMIADNLSQPMPVTAAANEIYKYAKMRKLSEEDVSAVYKTVRN